jgi:hypothetical protein
VETKKTSNVYWYGPVVLFIIDNLSKVIASGTFWLFGAWLSFRGCLSGALHWQILGGMGVLISTLLLLMFALMIREQLVGEKPETPAFDPD